MIALQAIHHHTYSQVEVLGMQRVLPGTGALTGFPGMRAVVMTMSESAETLANSAAAACRKQRHYDHQGIIEEGKTGGVFGEAQPSGRYCHHFLGFFNCGIWVLASIARGRERTPGLRTYPSRGTPPPHPHDSRHPRSSRSLSVLLQKSTKNKNEKQKS